MHPEEQTIGHIAAHLAETLGREAEMQVELAKAEFARDAILFGRSVTPLAIGIPLIGVGYGFACIALALALLPWVGPPGSWAVVGGLNLLLGGLAISVSASRFRARVPSRGDNPDAMKVSLVG